MSIAVSRFPICRHTKTNGRRCQSPALTSSAFCYFHEKLRRTSRQSSGPGLSTNVLYPLRSSKSVQQALAMVLTGIASGRIHHKQSGKMLFALQIAVSNLPQKPR
jgi:hypothetical protein